jgi:phosphotransferase system enzyme I (PtsI)
MAHGPALVVRWEVPEVSDRPIAPDDVDSEIARLHEALAFARERLAVVRERAAERAGLEEARIFDAQLMILDDPELLGDVERLIRDNHFSAERAFELKMVEWRGLWSTHGSPLLRERLIDLTDVEIRVLTRLLGVDEPDVLEGRAGPVVLVARDLTPSLTVQLDRDAVLAIATEQGTKTSHAAILAHSIGIPAVVGIREVVDEVATGDPLLLDGWAGTLAVRPTEADQKAAAQRDERHRVAAREREAAVALPSVTPDGARLVLRSNLDLPEELDAALRGKAEGVGLMRTEFLVVGRGRMPDEDEQASLYARVAGAFGGHPVVIRTFDLGGDKFPAGFRAQSEANPFLGWRAIRVCLDRPEVFRPQVRAILRAAAAGPLKLMIPLVTRVGEVEAVRRIVDEETEGLKAAGVPSGRVPVGTMIETPAAVLIADRLSEVSDFVSVGTNDLVQYTLAVDRGNARLADRFTPLHPAVLRSLDIVLKAGAASGREVSVCGGMASDPIGVFVLLGLGYRVLSVAAPSLPLVRWLVRQIPVEQAAVAVSGLLDTPTAEEAGSLAREALSQVVDLRVLDPDA